MLYFEKSFSHTLYLHTFITAFKKATRATTRRRQPDTDFSQDLRTATINDPSSLMMERLPPPLPGVQTRFVNNLLKMLDYDVLAGSFPYLNTDILFKAVNRIGFLKDERNSQELQVNFSSPPHTIRDLTLSNITFFSEMDVRFIMEKFNHLTNLHLTTAIPPLDLNYLVEPETFRQFLIYCIQIQQHNLYIKRHDIIYLLDCLFQVLTIKKLYNITISSSV